LGDFWDVAFIFKIKIHNGFYISRTKGSLLVRLLVEPAVVVEQTAGAGPPAARAEHGNPGI
jgi:hypothetical protein